MCQEDKSQQCSGEGGGSQHSSAELLLPSTAFTKYFLKYCTVSICSVILNCLQGSKILLSASPKFWYKHELPPLRKINKVCASSPSPAHPAISNKSLPGPNSIQLWLTAQLQEVPTHSDGTTNNFWEALSGSPTILHHPRGHQHMVPLGQSTWAQHHHSSQYFPAWQEHYFC